MTAPTVERTIVSDDIAAQFNERASRYDSENQFFSEDFEQLQASGYLTMAVPEDLGGLGLTLAEVCAQERRIAYNAPATALATNMHLYWTGVAADLRRMGDPSLEWLLKEAANGEVFAAGHGERGNDFPLFFSTTQAERVDGGYKLTGRKMFGSLSPVWTFLGIHAMDTTSDPANPQIVHVFMPRSTEGYRIEETWDTLGMRATASQDTVLEGAVVKDEHVGRVLPAGTADLFVLSIFAWAECTFANVYLGLAQRAIDVAVAGVRDKTSLALSRPMAYHPGVQQEVAEAVLALRGASAYVDSIARDWSNGIDHGDEWPSLLVSGKHLAVEAAKKAVDHCMTISGGAGMFRANELERLYRDVRAGGFHPANSLLVHEIVGKTALGVGLDEQPRWG